MYRQTGGNDIAWLSFRKALGAPDLFNHVYCFKGDLNANMFHQSNRMTCVALHFYIIIDNTCELFISQMCLIKHWPIPGLEGWPSAWSYLPPLSPS